MFVSEFILQRCGYLHDILAIVCIQCPIWNSALASPGERGGQCPGGAGPGARVGPIPSAAPGCVVPTIHAGGGSYLRIDKFRLHFVVFSDR